MQAVAEGRLGITDDFIEHMNCCLGCRACETACPSGVQFGKLIEAAREQIQIDTPDVAFQEGAGSHGSDEYDTLISPTETPALNSFVARAIRRFFFDIMLPSRLVLTLVFAGLKLYQRSGLQALVHNTGLFDAINNLPTPLQGKLKVPEALMDVATGPIVPQPLPEITPAIGTRRYRVGFISGCMMDQVFRNVNEATIRVLTANGCEVITPLQQGCCGALHVHGGEAERGRALARHNIDVFEHYDCDAIIINSAGCGSTLKEYNHLLRDDPTYAARAEAFSKKVKDVSEFLASIELNKNMGNVAYTVAYHDACHLAHGQKIRQQPRQMLKSIPGLTIVDLKEADWCCGSAGIYNITNQEMGAQLLERKINNIAATNATIIATGNPGCTMQIAMGIRERGLPMEVKHPIQLLDEAYFAGGVYNTNTPTRDAVGGRQQQRTLLIGVGVGVLIALFLLGRRRAK
jgi:glycolate oxidase iron-sulfur subunit